MVQQSQSDKPQKAQGCGERCVLVLAPTGCDASLTHDVLSSMGHTTATFTNEADFLKALAAGAGAILLTEEAISPTLLQHLMDLTAAQPVWSDLPIIITTFAGEISESGAQRLQLYTHLRNVTFLERPVRLMTLASVVHSAIEHRLRQYQVRDLLRREQAARNEAEALYLEAQSANRMKDEFLAVLSHELRTPLNIIHGFSDLLISSPTGCQDIDEAIEAIHRGAQAQTAIVNDLLDISELVTGKMLFNKQAVALGEVMRRTREALSLAASARCITVRLKIATESPILVLGDELRLQQAIWNLLSNAIKFSMHYGTVELSLREHHGQAEIRVTDEGQGIEPDFLPFVFDRFRQQDGSYTRRHGGLGLGLAIVKNLTELHGGSVEAYSKGVGQGATFTLTLPILAQPPDTASSCKNTKPSSSDALAHHHRQGGHRLPATTSASQAPLPDESSPL